MTLLLKSLPDDKTELTCPTNEFVKAISCYCIDDFKGCDLEQEETALAFIGFELHSIQQGQTEDLLIHGHKVFAILMDQTCGVVSIDDILRTDHPTRPYQRLSNILNNKFQL